MFGIRAMVRTSDKNSGMQTLFQLFYQTKSLIFEQFLPFEYQTSKFQVLDESGLRCPVLRWLLSCISPYNMSKETPLPTAISQRSVDLKVSDMNTLVDS